MFSTNGVYRDFPKDLFIGFYDIHYWRIGLDEDNLSTFQMDIDWKDENLPMIDLPLSKFPNDILRSHVSAKEMTWYF